MTKEIWRSVPGFENLYEASNMGRIKSLARWVSVTGNTKLRFLPERILKGVRGGGNVKVVGYGEYLMVGLCKNGTVTSKYVHRVIWEAFNGLIGDKLEINHKDANKTNNRLSNLELGTHQDNTLHAIRAGLSGIHFKGSKNPGAVLNESKVRIIKKRLADGVVQRRIAEEFEVSPQTITFIKQGVTWTHV